MSIVNRVLNSFAFVGFIAVIFWLIHKVVSTENNVRWISDNTIAIAGVIMLLWLVTCQLMGASFFSSMIAAVLEGFLSYIFITIFAGFLIEDFEHSDRMVMYGETPTIDPTTPIVVFMFVSAVFIATGCALCLNGTDAEKTQ